MAKSAFLSCTVGDRFAAYVAVSSNNDTIQSTLHAAVGFLQREY